MSTIEKYFVPETVEEVTQVLAEGSSAILAGGTDLMLQTQSGTKEFQPMLVNISRVSKLKEITRSDDRIRIGALTTITDILQSSVLKNGASVLLQTANCFASSQIRNMATVGGNICNASPAGDMIIPLLLLDAEVELASWSDKGVAYRTLPLEDFFIGPGKARIQSNEILTSIEFPVPEKNTIGFFRKFGTRPALDISVVSVGVLGIKDNGCLRQPRVAFGAVAPTAIRGRATEAALANTVLDDRSIAAIAHGTEQEISPISDVRASAWYRKQLICHLTERMLHDVTK